jgi:hypothetical protein
MVGEILEQLVDAEGRRRSRLQLVRGLIRNVETVLAGTMSREPVAAVA